MVKNQLFGSNNLNVIIVYLLNLYVKKPNEPQEKKLLSILHKAKYIYCNDITNSQHANYTKMY